MKKIFIIIIIFTTGLFACDKKVTGWTEPQGFSTFELSFDANGGDSTITSRRDEWSLLSIYIDEVYFQLPYCENFFLDNMEDRKPVICSDSLLTVKYDFLKDNTIEPVSIECNWFEIIKENIKTINVRIEPNYTDKMRKITLCIYDTYATRITIAQSADSNTKSGQEYNFQYRNEIFPEIYYKFP
jgi:hypothetical protein